MPFRVTEYRSYCRCGSIAQNPCTECGRPVCAGGLCVSASTGECLDCARGVAFAPGRELDDYELWAWFLLTTFFVALAIGALICEMAV